MLSLARHLGPPQQKGALTKPLSAGTDGSHVSKYCKEPYHRCSVYVNLAFCHSPHPLSFLRRQESSIMATFSGFPLSCLRVRTGRRGNDNQEARISARVKGVSVGVESYYSRNKAIMQKRLGHSVIRYGFSVPYPQRPFHPRGIIARSALVAAAGFNDSGAGSGLADDDICA